MIRVCKKIILILLVLTFGFAICYNNKYIFIESTPIININTANKGYISIKYLNPHKKYKIIIEKDNQSYIYDFFANNIFYSYPLQMGDGNYIVKLMVQLYKNTYTCIEYIEFQISINNNSVFLAPITMINWKEIEEEAGKIVINSDSDFEKIKDIYLYVIKNVKYRRKIITTRYIPSAFKTLNKKNGMCYDFASLTAALYRAVGIPTKLVKGYCDNVKEYHAWNEVWYNGEWIIIDTAYDASLYCYDNKLNMIKEPLEYHALLEY